MAVAGPVGGRGSVGAMRRAISMQMGRGMSCGVLVAHICPVHMRQAELFVRAAVRRTTTRTERDRGGREEDTEKVQCGNEHRRTAPGLPGQPNEHPATE